MKDKAQLNSLRVTPRVLSCFRGALLRGNRGRSGHGRGHNEDEGDKTREDEDRLNMVPSPYVNVLIPCLPY